MGFKQAIKKPWVIVLLVILGILLIGVVILLLNIKNIRKDRRYGSMGGSVWGKRNTVVVISIDGFRYDMMWKGQTPNLEQLAKNGSMVPLEPQFPSLTFPNHYTLVTGRYPGEHGIIANSFYDSQSTKIFGLRDGSYKSSNWWKVEPIWTGVDSAVAYWPGSDVRINGKRPKLWMPYQSDIKTFARINQILEWIDNKNQTAQLYMGYLSLLDDTAHQFGPDSKEADAALKSVDNAIGHLLDGLRARNRDNVDLIIVSDHGSTAIPKENRIPLHSILPGYSSHLKWWECGVITQIVPKKEDLKSVQSRLKKISADGAPFRVYTRNSLPLRWHFDAANSKNVTPPVYIVAKPGHMIDCTRFRSVNGSSSGDQCPPTDESQEGPLANSKVGGHGYELREEPDMMAMMIVHGPHFKKLGINKLRDSYSNLDFYPMLTKLLGVPAAPNNGTWRMSQDLVTA
jgi:competence protein ComGC